MVKQHGSLVRALEHFKC